MVKDVKWGVGMCKACGNGEIVDIMMVSKLEQYGPGVRGVKVKNWPLCDVHYAEHLLREENR